MQAFSFTNNSRIICYQFCERKLSNNAVQVKNLLRTKLKLQDYIIDRILGQYSVSKIQADDLSETLDVLKQLQLNPHEIRAYPQLLARENYILNDNRRVLAEVGFSVTAYRLFHYKQIMNSSISFNEKFHFLPKHHNLYNHIFEVANINIDLDDSISTYQRSDTLAKIHQNALKIYLRQHHHMSNNEIDKYIKKKTIFSRSIRGIEENNKIIQNAFDTSEICKMILNYMFEYYPDQLKDLLNLNEVCGINIKKIMHYTLISPKRCQEIEKLMQQYKIPNYAVQNCRKIFLMYPKKIKANCELISQQISDDKFFEHLAIGHLICNIKRIKKYMEQQNINFYTTFDDKFLDFTLNTFLFKNSENIRPYLCSVFNIEPDELHKTLKLHPHWRKISFPVIRDNIEYLLSEGFTHKDISNDLYIIFYSLIEIKDCLRQLKDPIEAKKLELNPDQLTKSHILRLCVYLIEKKCGFNGEGVFLNSRITEYDDQENAEMETILRPVLYNEKHSRSSGKQLLEDDCNEDYMDENK